MKAAKKVSPQVFALTTVAGRVGLLAGITAGTVTYEEVEASVLRDTEKRPYRKPVVAKGKRYSSVTRAAEGICGSMAPYKRLLAMQKTIARYCNADNVAGYYWSE
jgi:hypothetical protein